MNNPKGKHTLTVEPLTDEGIHPFHWEEDPPFQDRPEIIWPDWGGPQSPHFISEFRRQMTEKKKNYFSDPNDPWPF